MIRTSGGIKVLVALAAVGANLQRETVAKLIRVILDYGCMPYGVSQFIISAIAATARACAEARDQTCEI